MNFINTITKDAIAKLPTEEFTGQIVVINNPLQVESAIDYLKQFSEVGFDTETRPSFLKGKTYKISLIQIATEEVCFLFRLNILGMPAVLTDFLKDESVMKIGLSLTDDFQALRKRVDFTPANFVDLQKHIKQYGIEDTSLQKIYAILFGKKISKKARLTNWDAKHLTESQVKYAALDAWACLRIYKFLNLPQ